MPRTYLVLRPAVVWPENSIDMGNQHLHLKKLHAPSLNMSLASFPRCFRSVFSMSTGL